MHPADLRIQSLPLPYQQLLEPRALADVDLVVIHCTELPDLAMAREYGERVLYESGTGNSGHFYIDRDGSIHQYVDVTRSAHHVSGYNPRSVGIELVNRGRYPHWLAAAHQTMDEPYPDAQIRALQALLVHLREQLPALTWIAGHEDLDQRTEAATDAPELRVPRKRDPGPMFPWHAVMAATPLRRMQPGPISDAAPL